MARKAQAVFTDLNLFKNQLQNAVIHTGAALPDPNPSDSAKKPADGQLFNLANKIGDNQAGLYIYKGSAWQYLPTTESIQQSIKDSVKGLKPKGSVNYTNWVDVAVEVDSANAANPLLKIGGTDQYRKSYSINFKALTAAEIDKVGAYLEKRFNYPNGTDLASKIQSKYNIDLGEGVTVDANFSFVTKTILLRDSIDDASNPLYGAYRVWKEDKSDPVNRVLYLHRVANFSDDIVDDGTTDGRPATAAEKDATNVYLFVQSGQQYVHKDVSFVQTKDAILGVPGEDALSFQQFSGAQDGLSASGSLRVVDGNTVQAITSKSYGDTSSEVLVTFDTIENIEATSKLVAEKTKIRAVQVVGTEDDAVTLSNLDTKINAAIEADREAKDTTDYFTAIPAMSNYEIVSVEVFHNGEKVLVGVDIQDAAKVGITYNTENTALGALPVTAEIRYRLSGDVYALLADSKKSGQWQQ